MIRARFWNPRIEIPNYAPASSTSCLSSSADEEAVSKGGGEDLCWLEDLDRVPLMVAVVISEGLVRLALVLAVAVVEGGAGMTLDSQVIIGG